MPLSGIVLGRLDHVAPKRQEEGNLHTCELPQVAGTSRKMLLCAPKSGKQSEGCQWRL